jgi:hypothetical protein
MFHWVVTILTVIMSALGLYAFIYIMMKGSGSSSSSGINLMTHDEFKGLPEDLKRLYRRTFLEIIVPAYNKITNDVWDEVSKDIDFKKEIEEPAIKAAKEVADMLESVPVSDIADEIRSELSKSKEGFYNKQETITNSLNRIYQVATSRR